MNDVDVADKSIGVLGATSLVGTCLLDLLIKDECKVIAFSRQIIEDSFDGVNWRQLRVSSVNNFEDIEKISFWICVAPIWVLPDYFHLLENYGVHRIVVLSSTSRFTKSDSSDLGEQAEAQRLADTEQAVQTWASGHDVEWVVLRPTLIYGLGQDKNISMVIRFIRCFGFFPLLGKAEGLRQPVHCEDVASICFSALKVSHIANRAYNISGGEILTYRDMVARVFWAFGMKSRFILVPLLWFKFVILFLRMLPRYKHLSAAMAERMNRDLVFDHNEASEDLGFNPRPFVLLEQDILVN